MWNLVYTAPLLCTPSPSALMPPDAVCCLLDTGADMNTAIAGIWTTHAAV